MDCIVHGVAKNRTQLSDFHSLTHSQEDSMSGLTSDICTLCTDAFHRKEPVGV